MQRLRVSVHDDFASSLCCRTHRVVERRAPTLEALGSGAIRRERVWTTLFQEDASAELATRTSLAARERMTGVPTCMLGRRPVPGIQQPDTMRMVLERFAGRARAERLP